MTDPRVTRHDIPSLNGRQLLKGRLRRQSDRGRNMCAMPASLVLKLVFHNPRGFLAFHTQQLNLCAAGALL